MLVLSSAALLRLMLLAAPLDASALSAPPGCEAGPGHLELTEDTPGEARAVCIHPGLSTSFFFDAKLGRVELAWREHFRVIEDETGLALVPTRALTQGERVPMTVFFQDGAAPASARFILVVHPSEAARQVEVTRQPRTLTSYREGEQQARAEARQCQEDKARLEARCSGQVGLLSLLAQELLGEGGIADKNITRSVTSRPGNTLTSTRARSYRSGTPREEGGRMLVRLALELDLKNNGSAPWTPAGAVLVGPRGVEWKALGVWSQGPIAPGESRRVGMEVETTEEAARGTFTLKLWNQEASGGGEFFDGVSFP
ncbi:uncharacterized protein (TIGR02268 family) [Archangium gephyra]|uniref:Uncharacterized protein (TIGR02268 family) n=1 Tax=Archangium gephyra TaxID=48 RepID=A0AAC8TDD1_9BACT|nr:DUF2381 family protein [Archangium gephyra]AKJ01830.1 Hypothetical protein AA314_03456 [Archangium gephyra]REG34639.1 uncharacterized protein (TIGR02268 family) [Archangium gephyra]